MHRFDTNDGTVEIERSNFGDLSDSSNDAGCSCTK